MRKTDRGEPTPTHIEKAEGIFNTGSFDYAKFSSDLEGLVCTKCGEVIKHNQLAFVMNFGLESKAHPLASVMRFTGLAWHGPRRGRPACLNVRDLPGCGDREGIEEDFARAIMPCQQSRETH